MLDCKQRYIEALQGANWFSDTEAGLLTPWQKSWLFEIGSMTQRLKQHCDEVSVDFIKQYDINAEQLSPQEADLLAYQSCLVREVLLCGDSQPWVVARTLIPHTTMTGSEQDMAILGSMPLGLRVFANQTSFRDQISIATVECELKPLPARRSRLWINDKPLLVSELFLPMSPIFGE